MSGLGDSQASIGDAIIRQTYGTHCAICLVGLPRGSAYLLDQASRGADQHAGADALGLLTSDFRRSSAENGHLLCASCHLLYFTPNHIALCPSLPVLQYINNYLNDPQLEAEPFPLHQVFQLLRDARTGTPINLPDPSSILPFLDLYTLLILNPEPLVRAEFATTHFPPLSFFQDGRFQPPTTRLAEAKAVRIFDPIDVVANNRPVSLGIIPLSSENEEFERQFYWRLPIHNEIILSMLLSRSFNRALDCVEIDFPRMIHGTLLYQQGAHGRSGSVAGRRGGKSRTLERGEPQTKKPRMEKTLDEEQSLVSSREWPHFGVNPTEWEIASTFSTLINERAITNSGGLAPNTRESDCYEDDPRKWMFGPSLSSDMVIAAARRIMSI